jgi:drug/metabolite transporter (DMT)-like permease
MMRWLVADAHPEAGTTLQSLAVGSGWAALVLWLVPQRRVPVELQPPRQAGRLLLAGVLLLCGPQMALLAHALTIDPGGLTMALALTPVVLVVAGSVWQQEEQGEVAGQLWPGLAAVGGLLLILVQPALDDPRNDIVYLLTPILTGLGAVLYPARPRRGEEALAQPSGVFLALRKEHRDGLLMLLGAAAVFAVGALVQRVTGAHVQASVLAVAWDGVTVLLSVLALERLSAQRWAAQFVLLPLLILIEGLVLVHPPLTVRWIVGLALLAAAAVYLLLPPAMPAESLLGSARERP